ncbi:MAG: four helix bundle protein [Gemmatimonadaceae bacterium]
MFEQTRGRAWSYDAVLRERLQRSALAIVLHIMRGARHENRHHFPRALDTAIAGLRELAYCLVFTRDLGLLSPSTYATLEARAAELERMLIGLRHRLRSSGGASRPGRRLPRAGAAAPPATARAILSEALELDGAPQSLAPDLSPPLGLS